MYKPIAESCLRNQEAIYSALLPFIGGAQKRLLEIGSGTGQHAAHICKQVQGLIWQPSDVRDCIEGIEAWRQDLGCANMLPPLELDVNDGLPVYLRSGYDFVFTANTIHFVSEKTARNLLRCAAEALKGEGHFFVYGPFNKDGQYTSEGNARLDQWLRERDSGSGIKDFQWLYDEIESLGLSIGCQALLPANNWLLEFYKSK